MKLFFNALVGLAALALMTAPTTAQETRTFVDDIGRSVEIPTHPVAIVSLDDLRLTVPMIELGVALKGSQGRVRDDGSRYIRAAMALTGVDFSNSLIAFVGADPIDLEAIVAAAPDMIITLVSRDSPIEQLQAIAPTVVLDEAARPPFEIYDLLADLTGTKPRLEALKARYQADLSLIRSQIDTANLSAAVIEGNDGQISSRHTYGSLGTVLRDAGFTAPAIVDAIPLGDEAAFSAENLQAFDADYLFDTFRDDRGETPLDAIERMNGVLPDFCSALTACADGHYIIVPRDAAYAVSYQGLSLMGAIILSNIAGRTLPVAQ